MTTIQLLPQPVSLRVHALATAAGCQLVASCDLAVAAESAGFAAGGKGGLFSLTLRLSRGRTSDANGHWRWPSLATRSMPPRLPIGDWSTALVRDEELDAAVDDLMRRATRGSARSALGKRTFYRQIDLPQPAAYEFAGRTMAAAVTTTDAQEGIAAFLEKRRPKFQR